MSLEEVERFLMLCAIGHSNLFERNRYMSDSTGLTGSLFEEKAIGTCRAQWTGVYLRFNDAVAEVRKNQPPLRTSTAAKLSMMVTEQLGKPVRFYTAVKSCADIMHGIDGFFEIEGGAIIVTVDLTLNSNKDACKADLLIGLDDVRNLPALAARVVGRFQTKLRRASAV